MHFAFGLVAHTSIGSLAQTLYTSQRRSQGSGTPKHTDSVSRRSRPSLVASAAIARRLLAAKGSFS
ncbi:hypothetical protein PsYK624_125370 [Phanerochaete sordida]|uniref:Uncharacterized protein n=1 Tax=Phanerochaete sordida TaxID=48140 RepID=A0A9P3LIN1_9APHY|nr:hypothetical protein PsYK624_125370 [Phanerochaete sordida]